MDRQYFVASSVDRRGRNPLGTSYTVGRLDGGKEGCDEQVGLLDSSCIFDVRCRSVYGVVVQVIASGIFTFTLPGILEVEVCSTVNSLNLTIEIGIPISRSRVTKVIRPSNHL